MTPVARHRRREYTGDASGKARGRSRGGDNEKASGIVVTSTNSDGSEWNSRAAGRDNGRQGAMTLNEAEEADSGHPGSSRIFFDADKQYAKGANLRIHPPSLFDIHMISSTSVPPLVA